MKRKIYSSFIVVLFTAALLSACSGRSTVSSSAPGAFGFSTTPGSQSNSPSSPNSKGPVLINGAGSTFAQPVYTEWIQEYQDVNPAVILNYQGIGSGGGKKGIIDHTIDFAGSDSVLKDDEYTAGNDLQMYPMIAGAVVMIYNIQDSSYQLVLDGKTLEGIYAAKIASWNDPAIVATNPGVSLPDAPITVVHRSDGSGTTEIFTNALASFNPDWKTSVGAGTSVQWPVDAAGNGIGGKGSQGVAAAVQNTPNSIGYVELSYAIANKIPVADMVNKAGNKVTANADSMVSAMNDFASNFTDKLTNTIVDGPGTNTWPIAGYTYLILHTTSMADCNKAKGILDFFKWALTDPAPARSAADLGYSVLPDAVQSQVLDKMAQVTCNNSPVMTGH